MLKNRKKEVNIILLAEMLDIVRAKSGESADDIMDLIRNKLNADGETVLSYIFFSLEKQLIDIGGAEGDDRIYITEKGISLVDHVFKVLEILGFNNKNKKRDGDTLWI